MTGVLPSASRFHGTAQRLLREPGGFGGVARGLRRLNYDQNSSQP